MPELPTRGISELVLEVEEMDRAVEFWNEKLGFPVVEQWGSADGQFTTDTSDGVRATWLYVGGNTRLGLWLPRDFDAEERERKRRPVSEWPATELYDEGGEHVHFALSIEQDDFEDAEEKITNAGIETTVRSYDAPQKSLYFEDTEGNVIELYTLSMREQYGTAV